jgi:Fic family protein
VAANLAAITSAVEAAAASPLSVDLLCQWHQILMTGSPTPASLVGRIRSEQGWIGGTSPLDAVLVPPPPDALPALLDDLVDYVNHAEVDPVTQAAVAHAQFELIHPFGDGNGRVGRILVAYILTRRMSLLTPPPVSTGIAADVGGYSAGLALFRLGDHDRWIQWFADAVTGAGSAQRALVDRVEALRQEWRARLARTDPGLRSDSSVWRVLDLLPQHLLLTAPLLQQELDLSGPSARRALEVLAAAGVLTAHSAVSGPGRGRPRKLFVSHDLLGLTGSQPLR